MDTASSDITRPRVAINPRCQPASRSPSTPQKAPNSKKKALNSKRKDLNSKRKRNTSTTDVRVASEGTFQESLGDTPKLLPLFRTGTHPRPSASLMNTTPDPSAGVKRSTASARSPGESASPWPRIIHARCDAFVCEGRKTSRGTLWERGRGGSFARGKRRERDCRNKSGVVATWGSAVGGL